MLSLFYTFMMISGIVVFAIVCVLVGVPLSLYSLSMGLVNMKIINELAPDFHFLSDTMSDSVKAFLLGLIMVLIIIVLARYSRLVLLTACISVVSVVTITVLSSYSIHIKFIFLSIVLGIVGGYLLHCLAREKVRFWMAAGWRCNAGIIPSLIILFETIVAYLNLMGCYEPYTFLLEMPFKQLMKWPAIIVVLIGICYFIGREIYIRLR